MVSGDSNYVLNSDERMGGPLRNGETTSMRECLFHCELHDLHSSGNKFTWNKKQEAGARVFSKIDRVLVNTK